MYRSLTMLATDQPGEAQEISRLIRLAKHKSLLPMTKAIGSAAIVLMGVAHMVVMAATGSDFPLLAYAIEGLILIAFLFAARGNLKKARHDPLRLCSQAEEQYQFGEARITDSKVRTVRSGKQSYEVIDAKVSYQSPGQLGPLQIVETFDKSIWNFEPAPYPIPARVVFEREKPTQASLISISKSAVDAIPEGKKRNVRGYAIGFALVILLFVFALACLAVALLMLPEKFGFRVR